MSEISMIVPIEGFPGYLISDAGHVLSTKRGQTIHELRQEENTLEPQPDMWSLEGI